MFGKVGSPVLFINDIIGIWRKFVYEFCKLVIFLSGFGVGGRNNQWSTSLVDKN